MPQTLLLLPPLGLPPSGLYGVAAARVIQHILLAKISCRSQRIDSTQNREWVVQSRDY